MGTIKNEVTREAILDLLTDDELAKVSSAEGAPRLVEGDEYVDLTDLRSGVQRAQAASRISPSRVLPRSAVTAATWGKILTIVAH